MTESIRKCKRKLHGIEPLNSSSLRARKDFTTPKFADEEGVSQECKMT